MSSDIQTPRVEQVQIDELPCWRIHTAYGEALIAQQGAQLLSYQPHEQPPLVWLSDTAEYRHGQSLRGGAPVCWPWFGNLERNPVEIRTAYQGDKPPPTAWCERWTGSWTISPTSWASFPCTSASTRATVCRAGPTPHGWSW